MQLQPKETEIFVGSDSDAKRMKDGKIKNHDCTCPHFSSSNWQWTWWLGLSSQTGNISAVWIYVSHGKNNSVVSYINTNHINRPFSHFLWDSLNYGRWKETNFIPSTSPKWALAYLDMQELKHSLFLATIQMENCIWDRLMEYWATVEQILCPCLQ